MGPVIGIALALALAVAASPPALPPEGLVRALREARIAGAEGDPERQRRLLLDAARRFPGIPEPLLELVTFHARHGGAPAALAEARTALRPLLLEGRHALPPGVLQLLVEDTRTPHEDLAALARYLATRTAAEPGDHRMLRLLAHVQGRLAQPAEARATLGRLLEVAPKDDDARALAVELDLRLGRWDDALAGLATLQPRRPNDPNLPAQRIAALAGAGRIDDLAEALAAAGSRVAVRGLIPLDALTDRVFALLDENRRDEAERLMRAIVSVDRSADRRRLLVELFGSADERATLAGADERRRATLTPEQLVAEGSTLLAAGNAREALPLLAEATQRRPNWDIAWYDLALAAQATEDWPRAEAAFARAAALRPGWFEARIGRADMLVRMERFADALPLAETLAREAPGSRRAWLVLALALQGVGQMDRAREAHRRYLALAPPS